MKSKLSQSQSTKRIDHRIEFLHQRLNDQNEGKLRKNDSGEIPFVFSKEERRIRGVAPFSYHARFIWRWNHRKDRCMEYTLKIRLIQKDYQSKVRMSGNLGVPQGIVYANDQVLKRKRLKINSKTIYLKGMEDHYVKKRDLIKLAGLIKRLEQNKDGRNQWVIKRMLKGMKSRQKFRRWTLPDRKYPSIAKERFEYLRYYERSVKRYNNKRVLRKKRSNSIQKGQRTKEETEAMKKKHERLYRQKMERMRFQAEWKHRRSCTPTAIEVYKYFSKKTQIQNHLNLNPDLVRNPFKKETYKEKQKRYEKKRKYYERKNETYQKNRMRRNMRDELDRNRYQSTRASYKGIRSLYKMNKKRRHYRSKMYVERERMKLRLIRNGKRMLWNRPKLTECELERERRRYHRRVGHTQRVSE